MQASPDDWGIRSIFSDWCSDNDFTKLSDCLRWMTDNKKRPYKAKDSEVYCWFNASAVSVGLEDQESDIPEDIYKALEGGKESANHKVFPSFVEAEEAFYEAWEKVNS